MSYRHKCNQDQATVHSIGKEIINFLDNRGFYLLLSLLLLSYNTNESNKQTFNSSPNKMFLYDSFQKLIPLKIGSVHCSWKKNPKIIRAKISGYREVLKIAQLNITEHINNNYIC